MSMSVTRPSASPAVEGAAKPAPTISVVIACYNYGRYLPIAIDSVLAQDAGAEIIVVDDCSTDNSRDVMQSYGDRIIPIYQVHNQGHGGAFNVGFQRATGDLIQFLDADDFILPGALKRALSHYEPGVAIYHFRMRYSNEDGALNGIHPAPQVPLGIGDVSRQLREFGRYYTQVSSGLVFSREALAKVMPLDAEAYRMSAEGYLVSVLPLYGPTRAFEETLSAYRLHGAQNWKVQTDFAGRARKGLRHDFERYKAIREHAGRLGLPVADNLGDADLEHLNDRLISLAFDADEHPIAGDSIAKVVRLAKAVRPEGTTPRGQLTRTVWWTAMGVLPAPARRQLLRWKMDPRSRPAWLASSGRFLRKRLGIVLR
jgi:glycosyltransferase involved in cell wall biosynthesis